MLFSFICLKNQEKLVATLLSRIGVGKAQTGADTINSTMEVVNLRSSLKISINILVDYPEMKKLASRRITSDIQEPCCQILQLCLQRSLQNTTRHSQTRACTHTRIQKEREREKETSVFVIIDIRT